MHFLSKYAIKQSPDWLCTLIGWAPLIKGMHIFHQTRDMGLVMLTQLITQHKQGTSTQGQ